MNTMSSFSVVDSSRGEEEMLVFVSPPALNSSLVLLEEEGEEEEEEESCKGSRFCPWTSFPVASSNNLMRVTYYG